MKARILRTCFLVAFAFETLADLPLARLHSVVPNGGQPGTTLEVKIEGADLDDASELHFSASGIVSERKASHSPGIFSVTIGTNVPPGIYEARSVGRFGISNPRFFFVDDRTNLVASGGNQSFETAVPLPMESTISAVATASGADFFRFEARASEPLLIGCAGDPFDSKMKPALVIYDAAQRELGRDRRDSRLIFHPPATGFYTVKVHDLQFRGGKEFPYRLTITTHLDRQFPPTLPHLALHEPLASFVTAEQEPNDRLAQNVNVPCEIRGQFFPEGDIDRFEFDAKKGSVFWIEATSDRAGQATAPFILVQKVVRADRETVTDLQELYGTDANVGGPTFNTATRDPNGRVEIKENGTYRVQIRDLFNTRADLTRSYRLSVRPETPDFDLVALVAPPPTFEKDKREAQVWSSLLRRHDTLPIKVLALRRDNFAGEIVLRITGLPEGVRASEGVIAEGQNAGWVTLTSNDKPVDWTAPIHIIGKAKVGARDIERVAAADTVVWDVADYNNESVRSRFTQELMLATVAEAAPFKLEAKQSDWQVPQANTVSIPLQFTRAAEFKQPIKLRAYLDNQSEPLKEWQVEGTTAETTFDLDVKGTKMSVGAHQLLFLAQTSGKIRRVRAEEVAALDAEMKKDETKKKEIEGKLQWRDVTAVFSAPMVKVVVNPPPTASK